MLVDYIPADKLPHFIVWLDWCFYAYRTAFFVVQAFMVAYSIFYLQPTSIGTTVLSMFIGFCFWVVWCFLIQGHGVG